MSDPVMVPPMLYLPVRELPDGRQIAEVRALVDGRQALIAYTALDRLAANCGAKQPWVVIPTESILEIQKEQPFQVVAFDRPIPETLRADGRIA